MFDYISAYTYITALQQYIQYICIDSIWYLPSMVDIP